MNLFFWVTFTHVLKNEQEKETHGKGGWSSTQIWHLFGVQSSQSDFVQTFCDKACVHFTVKYFVM